MSRRNKKPSRAPRPNPAKQARVQNNVTRSSGIGTNYDYGQYQQPAFTGLSPFQQDKFAVDLYFSDWAAKKIVSIPVDDMLRDGWGYDGVTEEQKSRLETAQDALGVLDSIKQAARLERLIGGCVIFMGIADGADDPSLPVNHAALQAGCLKFMNVIPRTRVTKTEIDTDVLSPSYGRPITYWVNGQQVHHSRLLLFKGDPLLPVPDSSIMPTHWTRNDGFGVSVLMNIIDDLTRATGSRQAAYQLVQRASVFLYQTDTLDLSATKEGQSKIQMMQEIINQINLFRGAVIDRAPGQADPITTISPQFGSVPELVMTFLQILSAASDIPATRFLGQAPGGLNATGESDLENYYGRLESAQRQDLRPKLIKLLSVMGPSVLGAEYNPKAIDVTFKPLWSLSEVEQSTVRMNDAGTIQVLSQWLSDAELLAEAKHRDVIGIELAPDREPVEPVGVDDPAADLAASIAELGGAQ